MHKATEISSEEIVRLLAGSELGFLPLLADGPSELDSIAKAKTCDDDIVFCGERSQVTCRLFPVFYHRDPQNISNDLIRTRAVVVREVFARWTAAGHNKSGAKSPFTSKDFNDFLNKSEYLDADYLVLYLY